MKQPRDLAKRYLLLAERDKKKGSFPGPSNIGRNNTCSYGSGKKQKVLLTVTGITDKRARLRAERLKKWHG